MEVIDKVGNVLGRVVTVMETRVSGGCRTTRKVVVARLMLPGRTEERQGFDSVFAARDWVVREAGA